MTSALTDPDRPLRLHPLTFLEQGDEVTVGRADIDSYGLFPPDGAALLRQLEAGVPPGRAASWYQEQYGEPVDIDEFIEVLGELELLVEDGEQAAAPAPVRWQRLGRALFSPAAWTGYAVLVGAAVAAMVAHPELVPTYRHLFFTHSSLLVLTLGIVLGQLPLILLHEAFHALAGRRLGLNSRLRIGRRFYYLVFLTEMDGLVVVPRRQRYLPMLAGMVLDVLAIAALTLVAAALLSTTGAGLLIAKLCLAAAFGVVLRLVWQLYFFLRTDLYYLVSTVLGCNDLQAAARQLLRNRLNRLLRRPDRLVDEATMHPRDLAVGRWYSWLLLSGYLTLTATLVTAVIPAAIRITEQALRELGSQLSVLGVLDVSAFLVLNFGEFLLAGVLAVRGHLRRGPRAAS
jgi:hypothetical protein